jgi:hypothetical protein
MYGINRLDDQDLDFFKDLMIHSQHSLTGAAGSLAARANVTGGYAPEVA